MSARKLRLLAECLEREFMTTEDRRGWVTDLRGAAKQMERSMTDARQTSDERRTSDTDSRGSR